MQGHRTKLKRKETNKTTESPTVSSRGQTTVIQQLHYSCTYSCNAAVIADVLNKNLKAHNFICIFCSEAVYLPSNQKQRISENY